MSLDDGGLALNTVSMGGGEYSAASGGRCDLSIGREAPDDEEDIHEGAMPRKRSRSNHTESPFLPGSKLVFCLPLLFFSVLEDHFLVLSPHSFYAMPQGVRLRAFLERRFFHPTTIHEILCAVEGDRATNGLVCVHLSTCVCAHICACGCVYIIVDVFVDV